MSEDFEAAKTFLKKATPSGTTLYDHLTNVLLQIVKEKPSDAVQSFESISVKVKNSALEPPQYKELPALAEDSAERKAIMGAVVGVAHLIQPPKKGEEEEEEEAEEPNALVPDIMGDMDLLEWAGVNLGREEMYKLALAMESLSKQELAIPGLDALSFAGLRFWGKMFGTQNDYYIIEAKPLQ